MPHMCCVCQGLICRESTKHHGTTGPAYGQRSAGSSEQAACAMQLTVHNLQICLCLGHTSIVRATPANQIISYHIISYHIISYHIISYHIISYHIISYHIISYHIIPLNHLPDWTSPASQASLAFPHRTAWGTAPLPDAHLAGTTHTQQAKLGWVHRERPQHPSGSPRAVERKPQGPIWPAR